MQFSSITEQALSALSGSKIRAFEFKTGQIFFGTIQKLFPNDTALVQAGGRTFAAKLQIPLETGKGYWFQTVSTEGGIQLKMLAAEDAAAGSHEKALLTQMQLPSEKTYQSLVSYLAERGIPFTKNMAVKIGGWLKQVPDLEKGLEAAGFMLSKDLPVTKRILTALLSAGQGEPATNLLNCLQAALGAEHPTPLVQQLLSSLQDLQMTGGDHVTGDMLRAQIQETVQKLGIFYEGRILQNDGLTKQSELPLKALLVEFLQKEGGSPEAKEIADQIIQKMNGQQLLSVPDAAVQHIWMEIPLSFPHFQTNAVMQWSGRQKKNGKIDSDYCKIIFYLNLQFLKETLVEMNVQNRVVTVQVASAKEDLQAVCAPFVPALKEGLDELNYKLSGVHFRTVKGKSVRNAAYQADSSYKGVDIRI
ncbi:hypothetical protein BpJC7_03660 [Weizmannia acidilactici]|uniref:Uncharacterized protein n=1 Tax=Weizmannia acidilactici TaxID=2607726 RepID=A0A5J4JAV3_9BACI|nr:hypothetical protein [Weizmannia acidilactici]GER69063.1 hypothetical protein BpJC7_03660 [Weizmannia acidilactici]